VTPHLPLAFAALGLVCLAGVVRAQTPRDIPTVVTVGEATVSAAPDQAFVVVTAENRARNPKDAANLSAQAMTAVQDRLAKAGIGKDHVRTLQYSLQPEFDWNEGKQTLRGYVSSNSIEVRLDDVGRVGDVVDLAVTAGATSVGQVRFDVADKSGLQREALSQASRTALRRAEAAAAGVGLSIDRVLRIDEQGTEVPSPRPVMMMDMRAAGAPPAPPTPVTPGLVEVYARVTVTAALK
jgi:uncharacterized protein YggE